jgi:hypothetical protein
LAKHTREPVRVLIVSNLADAEVAEYPESRKIRVVTRGESQEDARLLQLLADAVEYFEGENGG